jgi:spore coat protein U-like protein
MKNIIKTSLAIVPLTILPVMGIGATQGSKGSSSDGSLDISSTLQSKIVIKSLSDISFGTFKEGNSPTQSIDFCVGMNKKVSERYYTIKVSSDYEKNKKFQMRLNNGDKTKSDNVIEYDVKLSSQNVSDYSMKSGNMETNSGSGFQTKNNLNCSKQNKQTLKLSVNGSSTVGNVAGSYSDTLTVQVSPL